MRHIILSCMLAFAAVASADDYKIISMSHPDLVINGKQAKVGDKFSDDALVKWGNSSQVVRIFNLSKNKQMVMSAKLSSGKTKTIREILSDNMHLSTKEAPLNIQQQAVERVKEYCQLMLEVSGDVEKIELMDKIYDLCENNNVSVFNDLTSATARNFSDNSMPLQQYMMMLTDKFENNVKTSYSGYKYLKTVVQPSPLKEFDATSYAFIKVDKQLTINGKKTKQRLNIIVNTATMKVSSTISEDYEDPQRIYLEALEKFNEEDYDAAIPLLEKVSAQQRFSGRYRAMSMLGWAYANKRDYQKANVVLRESSQSDPLGGIILASKILMRDDVPINLRNFTEGVNILQKVGEIKDKDFPTHLIAKSTLFDAAMDTQNIGQKINLENLDISALADDLLNDPQSIDAFKVRGHIGKAFECLTIETPNLEEAKEHLDIAERLLPTARCDKQDFERLDMLIFSARGNILTKTGDNDAMMALAQELMKKPYALKDMANSLVSTNTTLSQALEYYRVAAENGDAYSTYIVSLSYFPWHKPLYNWESAWIRNIIRMKDPMVVKGWIDFLGMLMDENTQKKDGAEYLKQCQKAIDLGSTDAMEDMAICLTFQPSPCEKPDIAKAFNLACKASSIGLRNDSYKLFMVHGGAKSLERETNIPFESSETFKTLAALADQGNGPAAFLLYLDMNEMKDSVRAQHYLEVSKDAHCYYGMYSYAIDLLKNGKQEQAFDMFRQLTVYPKSFAYKFLGNIAFDYHHDEKEAIKYYMKGVDEKDYECCEAMSDMLKDGHLGGMNLKDNLKTAKAMIEKAQSFYRVYFFSGVQDNDETLIRLKEKAAVIDNLIAQRDGNGEQTGTLVAKLNSVLDASQGEDQRITLSQTLLSEVFSSPKAVVKTVGSNGKTVVSTETAEDFMLRLATMKTDKKMVEVSSQKDKNNKLTELTIQMK